MLGADGAQYWVANHIDTGLVPTTVLQDMASASSDLAPGRAARRQDSGGTVADDGVKREYLVVWAGDNNVLDRTGKQLTKLPD